MRGGERREKGGEGREEGLRTHNARAATRCLLSCPFAPCLPSRHPQPQRFTTNAGRRRHPSGGKVGGVGGGRAAQERGLGVHKENAKEDKINTKVRGVTPRRVR